VGEELTLGISQRQSGAAAAPKARHESGR